MSVILTLLAALIATGACAYHRSSLRTWAIATVVATGVVGLMAGAPWTMFILLVIELAIAVPLLMDGFRRKQISAPLLKIFAKVTPKLSETEQTALEAGTVGFEGELFSGKPDWHEAAQAAQARAERGRTGLHGRPGGAAVRHDRRLADHPRTGRPAAGRLGLREEAQVLRHDHSEGVRRPGFLGAGALGGAAEAGNDVRHRWRRPSPCPTRWARPNCCCTTAATSRRIITCRVLPIGEEIPCFALTGPYAGSDATSIPDYGIVCKRWIDGVETLGMKLTFDKRYITLAPIATVVGLAFRLYDPEHLLGDKEDLGITLALAAAFDPRAWKSVVGTSR